VNVRILLRELPLALEFYFNVVSGRDFCHAVLWFVVQGVWLAGVFSSAGGAAFTYRIAGKVYVNGRLMVCFDSEVLLIR